MGAFLYILDEVLFLQITLSFGANFVPANWEVIQRIAEVLAKKLCVNADRHALSPFLVADLLYRFSWPTNPGIINQDIQPIRHNLLEHGIHLIGVSDVTRKGGDLIGQGA